MSFHSLALLALTPPVGVYAPWRVSENIFLTYVCVGKRGFAHTYTRGLTHTHTHTQLVN